MIQSNELRIGSYFEWSPFASMGKGVDQIKSGYEIDDYIHFKDPITLTEDWLIKLGFENITIPQIENVSLKYWAKDAILLFYNESPPNNTYLSAIGFNVWEKYYAATAQWIDKVHELQNFYHGVRGVELTIKEK